MAKLGVAALLALLAASVFFAVASWNRFSGGAEMPKSGNIAMWLGIIFSLIVGCGVMALVFYSNRRGYDR